ncbi:MAG: hypothetical protein SGILL_009334 [Bacillariaceae sp.]
MGKYRNRTPKQENVANAAVNVEQKTTKKRPASSSATKSSSSKKKKTKRQQQKEDLKSKNTGVGLKISVEDDDTGRKKTNKIVFDDDNLPPIELEEEDEGEHEQTTLVQADEEDDDDDAIEEVQGSKARDEIEHLMEKEEKEAAKATKKKRKRKERTLKELPVSDAVDEVADLDDDFFSQLDTIRQSEAEEQRKAAKAAAKAAKGKHTTFVFSQHDDSDEAATSSSSSVKVGGNIEVVVLGNKRGASTPAPTISKISKEAMLYSRNMLTDGADAVEFSNGRQFGGGNRDSKKRKLAAGEVETWKRSKKGSTIRRRSGGKGRPAMLFSRKKR